MNRFFLTAVKSSRQLKVITVTGWEVAFYWPCWWRSNFRLSFGKGPLQLAILLSLMFTPAQQNFVTPATIFLLCNRFHYSKMLCRALTLCLLFLNLPFCFCYGPFLLLMIAWAWSQPAFPKQPPDFIMVVSPAGSFDEKILVPASAGRELLKRGFLEQIATATCLHKQYAWCFQWTVSERCQALLDALPPGAQKNVLQKRFAQQLSSLVPPVDSAQSFAAPGSPEDAAGKSTNSAAKLDDASAAHHHESIPSLASFAPDILRDQGTTAVKEFAQEYATEPAAILEVIDTDKAACDMPVSKTLAAPQKSEAMPIFASFVPSQSSDQALDATLNIDSKANIAKTTLHEAKTFLEKTAAGHSLQPHERNLLAFYARCFDVPQKQKGKKKHNQDLAGDCLQSMNKKTVDEQMAALKPCEDLGTTRKRPLKRMAEESVHALESSANCSDKSSHAPSMVQATLFEPAKNISVERSPAMLEHHLPPSASSNNGPSGPQPALEKSNPAETKKFLLKVIAGKSLKSDDRLKLSDCARSLRVTQKQNGKKKSNQLLAQHCLERLNNIPSAEKEEDAELKKRMPDIDIDALQTSTKTYDGDGREEINADHVDLKAQAKPTLLHKKPAAQETSEQPKTTHL